MSKNTTSRSFNSFQDMAQAIGNETTDPTPGKFDGAYKAILAGDEFQSVLRRIEDLAGCKAVPVPLDSLGEDGEHLPTSARDRDLADLYREATAIPEFQAAFGDPIPLTIVDQERDERLMPDPLEAQHECGAIVATLFDLLRDTPLESSAQAIAWGIVNSFHYEANKLAREEDRIAYELGQLVRDPDLSEVWNSNVEQLQLRCQTVQQSARAIECMRDYAATMYGTETGFPWSPAKGSKASPVSTASQIAAKDFLRERALENRERYKPEGPLVAFSGPQDWTDWRMIWDMLDRIKARIPHMILVTTGQRHIPRGSQTTTRERVKASGTSADLVAAKWAAERGVTVILFTPESAGGVWRRNEKIAALPIVEAVICEGSGIQGNLLDLLKAKRVPTHAFRRDSQRPDVEGIDAIRTAKRAGYFNRRRAA